MDFDADPAGLRRAVDLLAAAGRSVGSTTIDEIEERLARGDASGETAALELLAPLVLGNARDLGAPGFFAHMDPPTPWISWVATMWAASRNQNLLHPDTAPVARELEQVLIGLLAPHFGMDGGHLVSGSTIANLTALWAARESGASSVVASTSAHLSVKKAAHLLGLEFRQVTSWAELDASGLADTAVVITAGATSTGEIEPLDAASGARWRHVDAAWAGPLRLSGRHRSLLDGIDRADSVAVSAHKWLFQPKDSAMVLFADAEAAHDAISVDGPYLAVPNVGVAGSRGASAVPLLATVLAYGLDGVASVIDRTMDLASELHRRVVAHPDLVVRTAPQAGVVNWRHRDVGVEEIRAALPADVFVSSTVIDGERWLRSVAANPNADPELIVGAVVSAAEQVRRS